MPTRSKMSPLSPRIVSASWAWLEPDAGAAEDHVAAVGPLVRAREAVEVARAADQVVLAEPAEDRVVAAVALDPVAAVGADARIVLDRLAGAQHVDRRRSGGVERRAVALDRVVAELAEDDVVLCAAGDVVVAERSGHGRRRLVEQLDVALLVPGRRGDVVPGQVVAVVRVELPGGHVVDVAVVDDQVVAVRVEDRLRLQQAEPRAYGRAGAQEDAVVALDPVVAGAGVDRVARVRAGRAVAGAD